MSRQLRLGMYVGVAAWATWLGVVLSPPILCDDAAITLRYAERLATGHGFTYNDHERVQGASNPLYVVLLALPATLGVGVESSARFYAVLFFVLTSVLAAFVAERLSNSWGGLLAGTLLGTNWFFEINTISGMENGLAVALGLGALAALASERTGVAGLLVGLMVWNKLDAGALALAIAIAWLRVHRCPPWRVALIAVGVALPWFATAKDPRRLRFGSTSTAGPFSSAP